MDDLLKEAIADAKAVRETALENAKIALEEAFTPRLKSMLSRKIEAEMGEEEDENSEKDMEADEMSYGEAENGDEEGPEEMEDQPEMKMDDEEEMDDEPAEMKMGADEEEMEDKPEMKMDDEESEDDGLEELDLEAVLAELEADLTEEEDDDKEGKVDEVDDKDKEDKVDENDVSSDIGKSDNTVNSAANDSSKTGAQGPEGEGSDKASGSEDSNLTVVKEEEEEDKKDDVEEDIDLEEVLNALSEEEDAEDKADEVKELKQEIKETRDVVKFMREKLNEVNLLNAKLLFSNKLFRAFGLNNEQKLKVVENFDRTKNLREVKLVYATLAESFKRPSKLSESVVKGSSSKPVASTKPAKEEVLTEGAELKARFKKLANIL